MPRFDGQMLGGQLDQQSSTPTAGTTSRIIWQTTLGRAMIDNGTAYRAILSNDDKLVIGVNGTAATNVRLYRSGTAELSFALGNDVTAEGSTSTTLGSIALANLRMTEIATPANPAANTRKVYFKSDGTLYQVNSAGTEIAVSSAATAFRDFTEGNSPGNPAASTRRLYFKTDGLLYGRDSAGTETQISSTVLDFSDEVLNLTLVCSVAASALTIAIKTKAGSDPSSTNPVNISFGSSTAATGDYTAISLTAATSFVVSSGSTLGATNNVAFRGWIVGFNDAGTFRLGVINCLSGSNIYPLRDDTLYSSTAEGGAGAADSAQVFYTGTAVTTKPLRILGYFEYSAGLAAVGTYGIVPTKVRLFTRGMSLPGQPVQFVQNLVTATATGTTLIPLDDTIPQNTEGDQFLTQAITPVATCNLLFVESQAVMSSSVALNLGYALFQDSTANALTATNGLVPAINGLLLLGLQHRVLAGTVSSTTFNIRAGGGSAATTRINGQSGRLYGGVMGSFIRVTELQG